MTRNKNSKGITRQSMIDIIISKEQFLAEHNKLSPANLQATFALLTQFQEEKKPLLKDADWSFKLRIPFISWLLLPPRFKEGTKEVATKAGVQTYNIYPKPE